MGMVDVPAIGILKQPLVTGMSLDGPVDGLTTDVAARAAAQVILANVRVPQLLRLDVLSPGVVISGDGLTSIVDTLFIYNFKTYVTQIAMRHTPDARLFDIVDWTIDGAVVVSQGVVGPADG